MVQKTIFMGNGDHSTAQCKKIHELLDEGFSWLSGMQQPGDPCEPCTPEEWTAAANNDHNLGSESIMSILEAIASSLGAKVNRVDDDTRFVLELEMKKAQ